MLVDVLSDLKRVQQILSRGFVQKEYFHFTPGGVCYCMTGAVVAATYAPALIAPMDTFFGGHLGDERARRCIRVLASVLPEDHNPEDSNEYRLILWNDARERTQLEVMDLLSKAIAVVVKQVSVVDRLTTVREKLKYQSFIPRMAFRRFVMAETPASIPVDVCYCLSGAVVLACDPSVRVLNNPRFPQRLCENKTQELLIPLCEELVIQKFITPGELKASCDRWPLLSHFNDSSTSLEIVKLVDDTITRLENAC